MAATLISDHAHTNGHAKPGQTPRRDPSGVLNRLLTSNAQWAADVARVEPGFFEQCAKGQAPKVSLHVLSRRDGGGSGTRGRTRTQLA